MTSQPGDWDSPRLETLTRRKGTAGIIADLLRGRITDGQLQPGARLRVEPLAQSLNVSANIVREALQLLERERLVVQHLNRGIFVSQLDAQAVRDVYRTRRLIELGVLRSMAGSVPVEALADMRAAVELGERAIDEADWPTAGDATTRFHSALVSMSGGDRVRDYMLHLMAELRLAMYPLSEHTEIHRQFVSQHRQILEHIETDDFAAAEALLSEYLDDGERTLVELFGA